MRVEYNRELEGKPPLKGSPPLARGIPPAYRMLTAHLGITPACAGNTFSSLNSLVKLRDHPRLRGEYCHRFQQCTCQQGSPPLARGIRQELRAGSHQSGITPACAGNTLKKSLIYNLFPISISKFHLVSQTPEML